MDADDPDNYLRLAEIYKEMGQLDKAEQNVLLAKQRAPGNLEVIYNEASIYEAEGRFEDSIKVLSDAVAAVKASRSSLPRGAERLQFCISSLGSSIRKRAITRQRSTPLMKC